MSLVSEQDPADTAGIEPEADAEAAPETAPEPEERRYPSTIGGAFYLLILAGTGIGVGVAASGDWRLGIRCVGGALCFAAVCRLVLRNRDAGMLAVRSRFVDALILAGLGLALFFLALTIPDRPV